MTTTNKFERAAHHLMQMMQAYERRVRSDCTPEQIEKRPWECAEYVGAAEFLRKALEKPKVMVCGVHCTPGDQHCNNYCNLAPEKGPMAARPPMFPTTDERGDPLPFTGYAWLIETNDPVGPTLYYCGQGDWCSNPNHAMRWPSEEAALKSEAWTQMQYPGNMRIAEHEWVAR